MPISRRQFDVKRCGLEDLEAVLRVTEHPAVKETSLDDLTTGSLVDLWRYALQHEWTYVLMPNEFTVFLGVPRTASCYEVHTNILPEGRGPIAVDAAKRAIAWILHNTEIDKVISFIPAFNTPALALAVRAGFRKEGRIEKSFMKFGKLQDEIIVGLNRQEE
jgi:hypothetical protein